MRTARAEIENEVLKWPPAERVGLAERRLESVTDCAPEETGLAWRLEIARRVGEVESGKASEIPSRDVYSRARKKSWIDKEFPDRITVIAVAHFSRKPGCRTERL